MAKSRRKTRSAGDVAGTNDIPRSFKPTTDGFNYTRKEEMVPMRDGVKLFTLIMIPKDAPGKMPIILSRTPYNAANRGSRTSSPDIAMALPAVDEVLVRDGYIRVYQDIRGRNKSRGDYIMTMPTRGPFNSGKVDQTTDAYDTVDWLVKNVEGNNGRVGITGTSYDGFLTLMALLEPHPALKAAVPVNPMVDSWVGDDFYHNGALRTVMLDYVYRQTATKNAGKTIPWGYRDYYSAVLEGGSVGEIGRRFGADKLPAWNRLIEHPAYDAYWQDQAVDRLLAKAPRRVPVLTVHSLFDQEDIYGATACHAVMAKRDRTGSKTHIAIGPWCHGQMSGDGSSLGDHKWGADTSLQFRKQIWKPFWDQHLKGRKPAKPLPAVIAFETGSNEWSTFNAWPPENKLRPARLYLHPGGGLSFKSPTRKGDPSTEYVSDPAKPVPYRPRPIVGAFGGGGGWAKWLVDDQRSYSDRPDVLTFVSDTLTAPVTMRGEVAATLFASTTGTDADWVVKLIDLYPDEVPSRPEFGGYQFMVSGDIFRGRYREGLSEGRPIPSGEVLPYRVPLPHVNHTFLQGHRIAVQIQSSWFPVYDRNPQTFVDNIAWAKPEDYQKATHAIHHTRDAASFVEVSVQKAGGSSSR